VVSILTRSLALLAMGAATLADLSSGRFVLGLGAGSPVVAGWHGREFPARPRTAMMLVHGEATDFARCLATSSAGSACSNPGREHALQLSLQGFE
jgi:hypothetical protein